MKSNSELLKAIEFNNWFKNTKNMKKYEFYLFIWTTKKKNYLRFIIKNIKLKDIHK